MFKDYYFVLGVEINATDEEIKQAYRRQSIRWHPDKNQGRDTTQQMQDINEAYEILKDVKKRQRYDEEYIKYKDRTKNNHSQTGTSAENFNKNHQFEDAELENWIKEAREKAEKMMRQIKTDTKGALKLGIKEGINSLIGLLIINVLVLVFLRGCD